jgi:hypothetical protein
MKSYRNTIAFLCLILAPFATVMAQDAKPQQSVLITNAITGIMVYTIGNAVLLVYAGVSSNMVGIMLWPGAIFHTALAVWCFAWLARSSPTEPTQTR